MASFPVVRDAGRLSQHTSAPEVRWCGRRYVFWSTGSCHLLNAARDQPFGLSQWCYDPDFSEREGHPMLRSSAAPRSLAPPTQTPWYPDDLLAELQTTLAALADIEVQYGNDRERLAAWD